MTRLEKILNRYEQGYTATRYGDKATANTYMRHDFDELISIVEKLNLDFVRQQSELFVEFHEFCSNSTNKDTPKELADEFVKLNK